MNRLALILALWLGVATAEETPVADEGLALVNAFVDEITTFSADFKQTLLDADDEVVDSSAGRLLIQRPGQFRWDNTDPYEQWLIADGANIWSYDLDLEQVTVKPQAESLANTPAAILSGAGGSLDQFRHVETYREDAFLWVRLEPVDPDSGFSRMELGFLHDTLNRMAFFDSLGQTTLVQLDNVRVNSELSASLFEFVVPDGVDLIGTPVQETEDAAPDVPSEGTHGTP